MSDNLLNRFDYNKGEYTRRSGTTDWVEVGQLGDGGGYEWTDFNVFYSPTARRYFWHGDSGCSCNSWSDDLGAAADFEDGDRAALLRAWESIAKEHKYSINAADHIDGVNTIQSFEESK